MDTKANCPMCAAALEPCGEIELEKVRYPLYMCSHCRESVSRYRHQLTVPLMFVVTADGRTMGLAEIGARLYPPPGSSE